MISQFQFNKVLTELNVSFAALVARVEKLEKEVKDGDTKKGKSKG
jgi:hypothetical protein